MLDHLYAAAVRARRRWFERHPEARRRLRQPVVSVGNLSVGGTGKTPLVADLAHWLLARGERPAILSRGYARDDVRDGVVVVSDGTRVMADLGAAGDEPLLLAREVPGAIVAVAEDRHLAGIVAERRLGATVHLLDDGFQHVQLARDLDILMTTAGEIPGGRVLPRGRLREAADAAARAHVVVVLDAAAAAARAEAWTLGISQAVGARRELGAAGARGATGAAGATGATGAPGALGAVAGEPVVAVAGIAHPDQFFRMLREAGWRVAEAVGFADHHRYTARDVARLAESVRAAGATGVVTTAKDAIRLEPLDPLPFACAAVPMQLVLDDWDVLAALIDEALGRRRAAA